MRSSGDASSLQSAVRLSEDGQVVSVQLPSLPDRQPRSAEQAASAETTVAKKRGRSPLGPQPRRHRKRTRAEVDLCNRVEKRAQERLDLANITFNGHFQQAHRGRFPPGHWREFLFCVAGEQTTMDCAKCKDLLAKVAEAAALSGPLPESDRPVNATGEADQLVETGEAVACQGSEPQAQELQGGVRTREGTGRKRGRPAKGSSTFDVLLYVAGLDPPTYLVLDRAKPVKLQCVLCGWVFHCHGNSDYSIERHQTSQAHRLAVQRVQPTCSLAGKSARESERPACVGIRADDKGYMLHSVREALEIWFGAGCPAAVQHPYEGYLLSAQPDGALMLRASVCKEQGAGCIMGANACRDCADAANRGKFIQFLAVWGMRLDSISLLHQWILGVQKRDECLQELVGRDYWNVLGTWSAFAERVRQGTFEEFLNSLREQLLSSPVKTRNSSLRMLLEALCGLPVRVCLL